jgi:GntR family transcriptional regulator
LARPGRSGATATRLLETSVGTPTAQVTRVFLDRQGQALYCAEVLYRGDGVKREIDLQTRRKVPRSRQMKVRL